MSKEKESFCIIRERAPLSLDARELLVSVWDNAFHGDFGRPEYCVEGGAEEDRVIVDANASRLVPKCSDLSEDVGLCKGGIGLGLKRYNDNEGSGVAGSP